MKNEKVLENAVQALSDVDVGGKKTDTELAALDRGILQVALMISGLDGTILPEEYIAFGEMAKQCRGATRKNIRALYDQSVGKAGLIAGMAQCGVYSESYRLAAFVRMSWDALPKGFDRGSLADLRRAFALWIAMGISDGAFSAFERRAVKALLRSFALVRAGRAKKFSVLVEPGFFAKAEKIFSDLAVPSRRVKAEAALKELIETVPVKGSGKMLGVCKTSGISLGCPPAGPTIPGWR